MLREWRDKWITALRSRKYTQGQGRLRVDMGAGKFSYCCMGVLCDVVAPQEWKEDSSHSTAYSTSFPSHTVVQVTGFDRQQEQHLAMLNDSEGKSFDQIADWIEANL